MTLPTSRPIPTEPPEKIPPARRRQQQRLVLPREHDERNSLLKEVSHRATPSADFFVFAFLSSLVMVAAMLLDSPALYVLVILLAPFMSPIIGMSLGAALGSARFFLRALISAIIGGTIFFLAGLLGGLAAQALPGTTFQQITDHSVFSWPDLLLLSLGAGLTAFLLIRSKQRPLVTSIALAYELYLPLGMAGFGLTSGVQGLFPDGLIVFVVQMAWAVIIGSFVLTLMGFRPRKLAGFLAAGSMILIGLLAVMLLTGFGSGFFLPAPVAPQPNTPTPTLTLAPTETPTETATPEPSPTPSLPPTFTPTLEPSPTATQTLTPEPTPIWARVSAATSDGANVREAPGYDTLILTTVLNGEIIQVLSEPTPQGGVYWVRIRNSAGIEGWVVQTLLVTATPAPNP